MNHYAPIDECRELGYDRETIDDELKPKPPLNKVNAYEHSTGAAFYVLRSLKAKREELHVEIVKHGKRAVKYEKRIVQLTKEIDAERKRLMLL